RGVAPGRGPARRAAAHGSACGAVPREREAPELRGLAGHGVLSAVRPGAVSLDAIRALHAIDVGSRQPGTIDPAHRSRSGCARGTRERSATRAAREGQMTEKTTNGASPPKMDGPVRSILATDCGSTTTKAILIEQKDGHYRLIVRGEAPTTVEAPFEDVTRGVLNAVKEVEELCGRTILDGDPILTPHQRATDHSPSIS